VKRRSGNARGCVVCGREDASIDIRGQNLAVEFFICTRDGCQARAHNDCLGFPNVLQANLAGNWFCPVHVGSGRPPAIIPRNLDVEPTPSTHQSSLQEAAGSAQAPPDVVESMAPPVKPRRGRPPKPTPPTTAAETKKRKQPAKK